MTRFMWQVLFSRQRAELFVTIVLVEELKTSSSVFRASFKECTCHVKKKRSKLRVKTRKEKLPHKTCHKKLARL